MIYRDPEVNRQIWISAFAGVLLFVALAVAGTIDVADEAREFQHYCDMIESGAWPDYRNLKEDCDEEDSEPLG